MPAFSSLVNSALAARNLSGSNLRAFAKTGCPEVSITCSTPFTAEPGMPSGAASTLGKRDKRIRTSASAKRREEAKEGVEEDGGEQVEEKSPPIGSSVAATKTWWWPGSISRLKWAKKSLPIMFLSTAARRKLKLKLWLPSCRDTRR